MGAFAAFKGREKMNAANGKVPGGFSPAGKLPPVQQQESLENPTKYTSKAMMAIWGMYNRYSVHNFKSNINSHKA